MLEQYTITTTPRYNFPHPTINPALPQTYAEVSLNSLRQARNPSYQLAQYNEQDALTQQPATQLQLKRQPLHLSARHQETPIAAMDTSIIKVGETNTGTIVAIRGATVYRQNRGYHYRRLGPLIFHLTEENKNVVYRNLERTYFGQCSVRQSAPTLFQIPMRLASLLERWLQTAAITAISGGLILFDGSLIGGTVDTPMQRMKEILSSARRNQNVVLAFSKATCLRSNGFLITDLLPEKETPYLLETSGLQPKPPTILLGDVYVARLSRTNMAFRLDIDRQIPFQAHLEAVEQLLGNDALQHGYPETLRLAHILCTFTANEVLAMQHFVAQKHGIQLINRPDMHRLLFGPFGREWYA